jgi:hypothetical protein
MLERKQIPIEILDYVKYDPLTGICYWVKSCGGTSSPGREITSICKHGYKRLRFRGIDYKLHRVIWFIMTGEQPPDMIDHIDRDKSNNKWDNLRITDDSHNQFNTGLNINNKTGQRGIFWRDSSKGYQINITIRGKKYTGSSKTLDKAIAIRDEFLKGI